MYEEWIGNLYLLDRDEGNNVMGKECTGGSMSQWCDVRRTHAAISGFDDGGRGDKPRNANSLEKLTS